MNAQELFVVREVREITYLYDPHQDNYKNYRLHQQTFHEIMIRVRREFPEANVNGKFQTKYEEV